MYFFRSLYENGVLLLLKLRFVSPLHFYQTAQKFCLVYVVKG